MDATDKRGLVERVADSAAFQKSPRLREFLLYVAECTVNDRLEDAREQKIAQNVFNRGQDYSLGQDNIVRVEARSLRKRLESYFVTDGKDEPVVIIMPRGSYVLSFEPREQAAEMPAAATEAGNGSSPGQDDSGGPIPANATPWRVSGLLAAIAVLSTVVVAQWLLGHAAKPRHPAETRILPFSALMDNTRDTYIVTSDACLLVIEELTRRSVPIQDYITGRYPSAGGGPRDANLGLVRLLRFRNYTDALEATIAGRILLLGSGSSAQMQLRSGHSVQLSDFQNRNVILLGGAASNPWTRLYSDKLNFQTDFSDGHEGIRIYIRNRSPRPGEQAEYFGPVEDGQSGEAYAAISFVPNVSGSGNALLIGGTTAEATAAAGDLILGPTRASKALKAIGIDPAGPPRYFEFLLKVMTIPGGATRASVEASRLVAEAK